MHPSIVLDHDPTFTNKFWKELFKIQGTQLKKSISYHPQIDGTWKQSTSVLKPICDVLHQKSNNNGFNGYLWKNCGIIPITMRLPNDTL